jgi:hypothetical protein
VIISLFLSLFFAYSITLAVATCKGGAHTRGLSEITCYVETGEIIFLWELQTPQNRMR